MAVLHNFSEREQKESKGKWKARKEGVCYLYLSRWGLAPDCFSFSNFLLSNWLRKCRGVTRNLYFSRSTWEWNRGVAAEGLEPLGGPCYPGSNKGQTHRDLHTPSPLVRAHTWTQIVKRKGNVRCTATCGVPAAGERKTCLMWHFPVSGLLFSPLLLLLFPHTIQCAFVTSMIR